MIKNVKHLELNITIGAVFLNIQSRFNRIQVLCCNKNYQHKFDKILKEQFFNTYKFSNHDNNKFI